MEQDNRAPAGTRPGPWFDRTAGTPFTPPTSDSPTLLRVVAWICMAIALYLAHGWWQAMQQNEQATARQAPARAEMHAMPRQMALPQAVVPPSPAPAPARNSEPTAGNHAGRRAASAPETTGGTIYLCRAYDGAAFWAQTHCNQHRALIDRIASVPPGMPFQQQVELARREVRMVQTTLAPPPAVAQAPAPEDHRRSRCQALDELVARLDAKARQPLSAQEQDSIRAQRRAARDEQYALRC